MSRDYQLTLSNNPRDVYSCNNNIYIEARGGREGCGEESVVWEEVGERDRPCHSIAHSLIMITSSHTNSDQPTMRKGIILLWQYEAMSQPASTSVYLYHVM